MTTLSQAVDEYLALRRAKHKPTTTRCDANDLRRLLAAVGNIKIKDLNKDHLIAHFYGTGGRVNHVQASTFNVERGRIQSFLNWALEEGYIQKNPMRGIDRRRVGTRERLRLTPEQMVSAIEGEGYPRDRALLAIVCNTALRAHAITHLRVRDVDLEGGYLATYTSKTEKHVKKPVSLELDTELRSYLTWLQQQCGPLQPAWFLLPARVRFGWVCNPETGEKDETDVLRPEEPLRYASALRVVHRTLERLGVDGPGEGLHTLRRSSARAVFEAGVADGDARAIHVAREFLDHENVAMTELYLGTSNERQVLDGRMRGKAFLSRKSTPESSSVINLDEMRKRRRRQG